MVKLRVNGTRDGAVAVAGRRKSSQTLDQQQGDRLCLRDHHPTADPSKDGRVLRLCCLEASVRDIGASHTHTLQGKKKTIRKLHAWEGTV